VCVHVCTRVALQELSLAEDGSAGAYSNGASMLMRMGQMEVGGVALEVAAALRLTA